MSRYLSGLLTPLRVRRGCNSADVIARVLAFYKKGDELRNKGHMLRAAENYCRAAEAARALGEDNLVALFMQLRQGNLLVCYAAKAPDGSADPRILAATRAECIALFAGAMEVLERRRVAGTLLEGKCAAAEEAWRAAAWLRDDVRSSAADAASVAAKFGYEEFLLAATNALNVLAHAGLFAAECSDSQLQFFTEFVVHAVELMQQPQRHGDLAMHNEATFTYLLREVVAHVGANELDARLLQLLAGALQQLQRSGVLQSRCIEERIQFDARIQDAYRAAVDKSLNAPGLRSCALPGCGAREAHPTHFKSCAACRAVVYCCREHQVEGWPGHKKACKAARKAAAAAEDEAGPSGA